MNLKDEILADESPVLEFKRNIPEYVDRLNLGANPIDTAAQSREKESE